MLNEVQIAHYYREGYVIVRDLIDRAQIEDVLSAASAKVQTGDQWQPTIFKHLQPHSDAQLHQLLCSSAIITVVEQLLGSEPRVFYGMLAVVPPRGGKGLPWHQDNHYLHLLGGALNTFVALCDITPEKGCLWVAPQSHRLGLQSWKDSEELPGHREAVVEPENALPVPLHTGDAVIFDRNTLHRSVPNRTDEIRFAYAAQYAAKHVRFADTGSQQLPIGDYVAEIPLARELAVQMLPSSAA
jgi:ectoine hydroxylase-related dioxygenase (phytanoyl-CoA dioxygenase family)